MEYKLDMSMMFAIHDALRRELVQVTRIARVPDDNPGPLLRAALGWELFKKFLTVHHTTEDNVLWPALRAQVAAQPDRLALADALEAEHAVVEPLLTAIDAAAADPDYGYQRLGDITDELAVKLTAHLAHEETDGLALIDASLTPQQWQHFAQTHGQRLGGDHEIEIAHGFALIFQSRTNTSIVTSGFGVPRQYLHAQQEFLYRKLQR